MEIIKKRRKKFSQEEKMEMVKLHYLEGISKRELAMRYGTDQSVVSRIMSNYSYDICTGVDNFFSEEDLS